MDFPKTFKDSLGREWTAEFGLPVESRMEQITGYTLDTLIPEIDPKKPKQADEKLLTPLSQMMANPRKLFDLFYALIKPQADKASLTREQVEEGFDTASAIESMTLATLGSVTNFIRWNPRRAWIIPMMIAAGNQIGSQLKELIVQVEKMSSADFGKLLGDRLATKDGASAETSGHESKVDGPSDKSATALLAS